MLPGLFCVTGFGEQRVCGADAVQSTNAGLI